MGICNGIAGVVGPLILGAVILKDADGIRAQVAQANPVAKAAILHQLAQRVILPYAIIVVALLIMAALIYRSGLPEPSAEDLEGGDAAGDSAIGGSATTHGGAATRGGAAPAAGARTSILQFPYLLLGVFTLFLYVGVEVIAGDTIINYGSSQGIPLSTARFFSSCTLSLMLVGYVLGIILIPKWLSQVKVLQLSGLMGLGFATLALLTHGYVSVAFIALLGLANAMVWPSIWPLAIGGLGRFTKLGASLLIVAVGGGALLPLAYGWLAGSITPHFAYLLVLPCYGCIWYYATAGHKIGLTSTATT
jgi:fucose permease